MARNPLRNPWRIGWLLGAWLLMALSLGALSDCLADRLPPPPRATATIVPEAFPVATASPLPTATPTPAADLFRGSATVGIGQASIPPGQTALVPIAVRDVTNPRGLGGYNFRITFDPAVVKVVSIKGGDPPFFGPASANINQAEGWVLMNGYQAVTMNGPRGPITVANLEVEVVGTWGATTTLGLKVPELIDTYGDPMAVTVVNGEVLVR